MAGERAADLEVKPNRRGIEAKEQRRNTRKYIVCSWNSYMNVHTLHSAQWTALLSGQ